MRVLSIKSIREGIYKRFRRRAIEPLIAAVIVTAVGITIAVAVSLWMLGVIGSTGYGTRPIMLGIYGDINVRGDEFWVIVKNHGGERVIIDDVVVDGKHHAYILRAYSLSTGESRLDIYEGNRYTVYIEPGESVEIWCVSDVDMKPGTEHEVRIHTTMGLEYARPLKAFLAPIDVEISSINTGLKSPSNPEQRIILVRLNVDNRWTKPIIIRSIAIYSEDNLVSPVKVVDSWLNGTSLNDKPITIKPGGSWAPSSLLEYFRADLTPGEYIIIADFEIQGEKNETSASIIRVSSNVIKAYVIYITEDDEVGSGDPVNGEDPILERYPAWYRDPSTLVDTLKQYYDVIEVSKMSELKDLIENPPEGPLIVINVHSEPLPIPKSYLDNYINYPFENVTKEAVESAVKDWHQAINNAVSHKWIWVHPAGYPFWGTANKRYARAYGYPNWTDDWGYNYINPWSNLDPEYGGARGESVHREGAKWATGWSLDGNGAHNDLIGKTPLVDEIETVFGVTLYDTTYGWATMDVSSLAGSSNVTDDVVVYYRDVDSEASASDYFDPIIYGLRVNGGDGWFLMVSLARPQWWPGGTPPDYDEILTKLVVYPVTHLYLIKYVVEE